MTKNRGLGKGMDAFFSDFMEMPDELDVKEEVIDLPLTELRPNPYQPRQNFDEQALNELAESIKQTGVFQPIIVRPSTVEGYEIIAGERRYRASKLAGKTTVPAIVRRFDEEQMMQIAVLENLQREDLNAFEEAEAYQTLMDHLHLTQKELAEKLGKSRPYIANYLRLLSLPDAVKEMVQSGELSVGQARTLLSLKNEKQMILVAEKVVAEQMTVRKLEQFVNQLNAQTPAEAKVTTDKEAKPSYVKESERQLQDKFGTMVNIRDRHGKGKIEIEFMSQEDLTRILDILNIQF